MRHLHHSRAETLVAVLALAALCSCGTATRDGHPLADEFRTSEDRLASNVGVADCLFNSAEAQFPAVFPPPRPATQTNEQYTFRHYPTTGLYLGLSLADDHVYVLHSDTNVLDDKGPSAQWIAASGCNVSGSLFTKPHSWTKDVSSLAPSPRSDAIVNALTAMGGWAGPGGRMQTDNNIVILQADGTTPRVTVTPDPDEYFAKDCEALPSTVPLPSVGSIEGEEGYECTQGGDCHLLVVSAPERKLYELFHASSTGPGTMTAKCVTVWDLDKQYTESLRGMQCTSADAAGLPMTALMPTADEVAAGEVAHAMRFILPNARMAKGVFVAPATHAGTPSSTTPNAPPYGVRFRLKASYDEAKLTSPGARVLAKALKKYGMILSDGGNIPFTIASDRYSKHKWAEVGIVDSKAIASLQPSDFEVVDLGENITSTWDCARTP